MSTLIDKIRSYGQREQHIAPLVVLRIVFGALMSASITRFWWKGWIEELYIQPTFHFTFYGFDWVQPLGATGMYALFFLMGIAALCILFGFYYRWAAPLFFLAFTYVELIDKTYYLNHYYFISIISFLLIVVPAHRYFSLDVWRKPRLKLTHLPRWMVDIFKFQIGLVYVYAGIAKLNPDWLFRAMPMAIWLPANNDLPLIGSLLDKQWMAYASSWFGALYDLTIPFFLLYHRTRAVAFAFVLFFHLGTLALFQIGMFPYIMIGMSLLFFSVSFHKRVIDLLTTGLQKLRLPLRTIETINVTKVSIFSSSLLRKATLGLLILHFTLQILLPWRYLLYPGHLFWTQEGYRFSWRVMLMEKAGTTFFTVEDPSTGNRAQINPDQYLTRFQEKMMSFQPDMILQFSHHLARKYQEKGIDNPKVFAESYVTLNGRGSQLFIDTTVNLADHPRGFAHKDWILPLENGNTSNNWYARFNK